MTIQQAFELALQHHQAGRLADAERFYRQILATQPNHPETWQNLGLIAHQVGRHDLAVERLRKAIALQPGNAVAYTNLGLVLTRQGQLDEALAALRRALALQPGYPEAHNNLGNVLRGQGRLDEALAAFRQALTFEPNHPEAQYNAGNVLREQGQLDEAAAAYRQALTLKPDLMEAHNNLGLALAGLGQLDEAVTAYRRALEFKPDSAEVNNNLAVALQDAGELEEADDAYRRAIDLQPANASLLSNLIHSMHLSPTGGAQAIHEEQVRWNLRHAAPLRPDRRPHGNDADPERRLKIGYVSPDFYSHAVSCFLVPLLEAHDHRQNEIYCYASVHRPDEITERLQKCADIWRDVLGWPDAALAERIREDGIDILVDLAMHTAGSRLPVFARQPAPVQVSWLAYPGSTGVETIDYRLTDAHIEPAGQDSAGPGEQAARLPDAWCCYAPIDEFPLVGPLPAASTGTVTFGSLNRFSKIHEALLHCWAKLLAAVPDSRLVMICPEGRARERTQALFAAQGVAKERVELLTFRPWPDYIRLFQGLDLALDSYPCNGMTTTCHALWMGVPVVTRAGTSAVSRAGCSLLHTLGLPELVAHSEEEFVKIATELAEDLPRLAELRRTLRPRMQASPLMDDPRFARNVEAAYREMWRKWCGGVLMTADLRS